MLTRTIPFRLVAEPKIGSPITGYELEISSGGKTQTVRSITEEVLVTLQLTGFTFQWRARSLGIPDTNVSPWSPAMSFSIGESTLNRPPRFEFIAPLNEVSITEPTLNIQWEDADDDNNATITFLLGDTLLATGIQEDPDGEADSLVVDLSRILPGRYILKARISDGSQVVTVDAPGAIVITP
jgi:hypothetical protein